MERKTEENCHYIKPPPFSNESNRDFQTMLNEGLDEDVDAGQISEKKRRLSRGEFVMVLDSPLRLSNDQVKSLEKNFDTDNKLEPDRKLKLAQELGLQPRQVAVWFQNRRARWKTKQLERDYTLLKANFDSLNHNYDSLKQDNQSLLNQITELKLKLYGEEEESNIHMKEDKPKSPPDKKFKVATTYFPDFKDGSSDSDSSGILNEDNNSLNIGFMADMMKAYQPEFVKLEQHNFFSGDETCNFFSDDQAPTLQWYSQDQWNLSEET